MASEDPSGKTALDDSSGLKVDAKAREELNAFEFENINKAIQKYLSSRPSNQKAPFTYDWFLHVHKEMLGDVWDWAGELLDSNSNIGIDKSQIREELKKIEQDYHFWTEEDSEVNEEEVSARLHHRLVWIHPFKNGNGRWARFLTNIHQRKHDQPLFQWPEKLLIEKTDFRRRYLEALREADQQNFKILIKLHQELLEKKAS